jgi:hypothetical protein
MEKMTDWFGKYKQNHKIKKKSSIDNKNKEWFNEEIDTLRDIAIECHVWEKSEEIYKRKVDFSAFSEIFCKFDEKLGDLSTVWKTC